MLPASLSSIAEIVVRSSVVYLTILLGFRLAGKRHVSQLSILDFALVLLVSNAVQNAMVGSDTSLVGGIVAAATLMGINFALTRLLFRRDRFAHLMSGEPRLLVRNGRYIESNLQHESIRPEEIDEQIREHGFGDISQVRTAILEIDGSISVIPYDPEGKHVEHRLPFVRRRHRSRRGLQP